MLFVGCFLLLFVVFLLVWCVFVFCWLFFDSLGASSELRLRFFVVVCWLFFAVDGCVFCWFCVFWLSVCCFFGSVGASSGLRRLVVVFFVLWFVFLMLV